MKIPEILEGPCYRECCIGPMKYNDGIFVCEECGLASTVEDYISWFKNGPEVNPDPEDDYNDIPSYDPITDDDGNDIFCPDCSGTYTPLKVHYGVITCPRCGTEFSIEEIQKLGPFEEYEKYGITM